MNGKREISRFGLYGEGNGASSSEFVHIESIAARSRLHNWSIAPHLHPNIFQVLHLMEGAGSVAVDGAEHPLAPSSLVIVPCGCVHAFRFQPHTQGWVLSIADALLADGRLAGLNLASTVQSGQVAIISLDARDSRTRLLADLLAELARRHGDAPGALSHGLMAVIGLILSLSGELASEIATTGDQVIDRRIALVRRFGALIETRLGEPWPVARYARELGTTAVTLSRACREMAGQSPAQMVLDRRLREARRALSYTDASIAAISHELGFSDPAYFARIFRQQTGMTASTFRKERFWRAG